MLGAHYNANEIEIIYVTILKIFLQKTSFLFSPTGEETGYKFTA